MFTLGIINDELSQDLEYTAEALEAHGVGFIELRSLWGKSIVDLDEREVERARQVLAAHKLTVTSIASPVLKCKLHPDKKAAHGDVFQKDISDYEKHLGVFAAAIRMAKAFETPVIRGFAFWREGDLAPVLDEIAQKLEPFLQMAADEEVLFALENEHACAVGSGSETRMLLDKLPHPNLKVVWDPGNAALLEQEPSFPEGYELVKDQMVHMHLKDPKKDATGKWRFTLIGEGVIGYRDHFVQLIKDGYEGNVSLETHFKIEGEKPEQGTLNCIKATQRLMAELG